MTLKLSGETISGLAGSWELRFKAQFNHQQLRDFCRIAQGQP